MIVLPSISMIMFMWFLIDYQQSTGPEEGVSLASDSVHDTEQLFATLVLLGLPNEA